MDRVRLTSDERLDIIDATALQELVYDHVADLIGGLVGHANGCISAFTSTLSVDDPLVPLNYYLAVGPFMFYASWPEDPVEAGPAYKLWKGQVVVHNPALAGNQPSSSKINYTTVRGCAEAANVVPGGIPPNTPDTKPFIWAAPILYETDMDARRQWDVATSQEKPVSLNTRNRTRVQFALSDTDPSDATHKYACIGKIMGWTGEGTANLGDPIIRPLSLWDGPQMWANTGEQGSWWDGAQKGTGVSTSMATLTSTSRDMGIAQLLHRVRARIERLLGAVAEYNWDDNPLVSVKTLADAVTALNSKVLTLEAAYITNKYVPLVFVHLAWDTDNLQVKSAEGYGFSGVAWNAVAKVFEVTVSETVKDKAKLFLASGGQNWTAAGGGNYYLYPVQASARVNPVGPPWTIDVELWDQNATPPALRSNGFDLLVMGTL